MKEKVSRTRVRKRRKQLFVERFGGKCELCGYNKSINSLVFHHIDPNNKKISPQKVIYERSIEEAQKELSKCILICANCHGELHEQHYDSSYIKHKFNIKPLLNKICKYCKKEFQTKKLEAKFCSKECSEFSQYKVNRPSKEELEELLKSLPYTKIGKMYGVADNTIRKWARKYELIK